MRSIIKPATPRLNGKVERSYLTDKQEFYQRLVYNTDDTDLRAKLSEWEQFYNLRCPHSAHNGKMPYEMLKTKLGI